MVGKARRNLPTMDLVVFPEYALHGLSMDTNPAIMCALDGPEVAAFRQACVDNRIWGCFSIMEQQPRRQSLQFRHHHRRSRRAASSITARCIRGCRSSRGSRATSAFPSITGPNGAKIALIICHDGMFPEMARECAYKGAEIMIRTAGYTAPIRDAWRFTNQSNAFCNLMVTANVCMCGSRRHFDSMGEGMIVNFDGTVLAHGTSGRADEIITAEVRPDLVREARAHWSVENNIYQLGHRGFTAVDGRCARIAPIPTCRTSSPAATACRGKTRCATSDGTSCGFPKPTRRYGERLDRAAE